MIAFLVTVTQGECDSNVLQRLSYIYIFNDEKYLFNEITNKIRISIILIFEMPKR